MRIAVIGAYGLIGFYVTARLSADGHEVLGLGRDLAAARRRFPAVRWEAADLSRTTVEDWARLLTGVEAVVNCAGALQDGPRDDLEAVHVEGVRRLIAGCRQAGVRRLVHISAAGIGSDVATAFSRTKLRTEALLADSDLDWIALRPGLVFAPAAYGGTALLRGLAGFPGFVPAVFGDSRIQVVGAEDLALAVARAVDRGAPSGVVLDLMHDEAIPLSELLARLRGWLGFAPAPIVSAPTALARAAAVASDAVAWLGWRSPMRSAALAQLKAGVRGRAADAEALGVRPRSFEALLTGQPSGVQERWFARAYFAKPAILICLVAFWLLSGVIGLTVGREQAVEVLTVSGMTPGLALAAVVGGSVVDIALALMLAWRRTARIALLGMLAVTMAYLAGGAGVRPDLWLDPMGPLLKSIPAAFLALAALTTLEER